MHALIIEDEFMIAMAIEHVLRDCGFKTFDIALTSQAAIEAAAEQWPDLITADVQLRPGCGIETVRTICPQPSTPVIFITGNAKEVRQRMPQHTVLDKPFSQQTLAYTVAASLS
jgi:DNA-binding response OmpR family regulator